MYFANGDIPTKLIRPSHIVLGANDYFFQNSASAITNKNIINVYITYKLIPKTINTDNALKNILFGSIEASRPGNTTDPDNFIYSGWGIGFDVIGTFTHPEGGVARNVIIFGVDMSGSVHTSNKTKDFLVLGKGLIQMIEKTTIYAEKMYSPNFSVENKIFVLSLHYNGNNSFLFVNGQKVTQFKANDSVISGANTRILTLGTLTRSYPSGANNRLSPKTLTTPRY